jgi:two-component system LytT family sensor kinase
MTDSEHSEPVSDASAEARARRRLSAERGFYIHLTTYVIVIGFLFLINAMTGSRWWFVWPALGWGIGILVHALAAFGLAGFLGRDWEERRLRELIEQEKTRRR